MNSSSRLIGGLLGVVLLLVGWLADATLTERSSAARSAAAAEASETARLAAMSVRTALSQIELSIIANTPGNHTRIERLATPPSHAPIHGRFVPYPERPSLELIQLLDSTTSSPQGFPESVLAALALEQRGAPNATRRKQKAAERLLSGLVPVRASDVEMLSARLGVGRGAEVRALRVALETAPRASTLPRFPEFSRRYRDGVVEGWSHSPEHRVHYEVTIPHLLAQAGVSERVLADAPGATSAIAVPDVSNLSISVEPLPASPFAIGWLRFIVWGSVTLAGLGLAVSLRAHRREVVAINKEKSFLANVTHELRTPLASVRVFAESLANGRGEPTEYGQLIVAEADRLTGLVDRVLTTTRVEEAPRLAPVHPRAVANEALSFLREQAHLRGVSLTAEVHSDGIPEASWDGGAVRSAILNLLDNAVRHGASRVKLTLERDRDDVQFTVTDDGPGIRPLDRTRVFRRFERGETQGQGTGLGLYMVEKVATVHGGRVHLEVLPDGGCRFTLTLPLEPRSVASP